KSSFSSANPNFVEVLFRFTKRNFAIAGIHHRGTEGTKGKRVWSLGFGVRGSPFVGRSQRRTWNGERRTTNGCVLRASVVNSDMYQLTHRPRRLRSTEGCRRLARETRLSVDQLIYPIFVSEKISGRSEVPSMPDVYQLSLSALADEVKSVAHLGIPAVLL